MFARFVLQFPGSKHIIKHRIATYKLNGHEIRENYLHILNEKLTTERSTNANERRDTIRNAIKSFAVKCCGGRTRQLDPWISQNSLNLIHQRRELPSSSSSTINVDQWVTRSGEDYAGIAKNGGYRKQKKWKRRLLQET